MTTYLSEIIWLNETATCSIDDLAEVSGLSLTEIHQLINNGVLIPLNQDPNQYIFQMDYIFTAKQACRLRDDFELDLQAVSVALHLLRRIHHLESELKILRQ